MLKSSTKAGFSLAETLMALGILAIGMLFIAGAFPVAIRLTTVSAERTTAAVVAGEAFAKVKLYGGRGVNYDKFLKPSILQDFNDFRIFPGVQTIGEYEFIYPSTGSSNIDISQKQYCWAALCRLTGPYTDNPPVQVTVFVCRKAGPSLKFRKNTNPNPNGNTSDWPTPIKIGVSSTGVNNQLRFLSANEKTLVNDDYTIVDNDSGQIYRVVKRLPVPNDDIIQLDRTWQGGNEIQVIPPAVGSGRSPCIAVYQEIIQF